MRLARPRTPELLTSPDFVELKRRTLELLLAESPAAGPRARTGGSGAGTVAKDQRLALTKSTIA